MSPVLAYGFKMKAALPLPGFNGPLELHCGGLLMPTF